MIVAFIIIPQITRNRTTRPAAAKGLVEELALYRDENRQTPEELMDLLWETQDIIFIGEPGKYHETTAFVTGLIPRLKENSVDTVAVSFLNYADQSRIDRLMEGDSFDESLARELLFNNLIMNGYREYLDFMKAVWEENRSLSEGASSLRLLGLNVEQDWSAVQKNGDTENMDIIAQVYAKGVPDTFMARVLTEEVIYRGEKALVYTGLQNSLSRLTVESYEEKMRESGFPDDTRRMARIIRETEGVRSCTVFLHGLWSVEASRYGIDYPLGGVLDSLMDEYEGSEQSMGFFTADTPVGELLTAPGTLGAEESFPLSYLCEGYLLLGPIGNYTPFTALPDFINEENFAPAVKNFPGPKEHMPETPEELNDFIAGTALQVSGLLEKFTK
ncbi:MAG: hypothetical protein PQJ60_12020 [Spirochaetales bacterium]|nr:hypothetical protein [Spirochaetales bacterium]